MKQLVLGTAGHIDHGKTTLVKALTGIETDRLKEEKARGITIELGFAHLDLPSGLRLGIVDVPGHEKFVKNMVAGAAGIDLVMLVIAADEGVMPQTREHLDICRLLGVKRGLVALTKADMVDEEWLELVSEDVAEYLEGSFLEGAPIMPVSSVKGNGVPELVQALDKLAQDLEEQPASGPFRLPVDRVFTMKGFGTVITGTAIGGRVEVGQEVTIYPQGLTSKVRGLQVHNLEVQSARRGQRTAVNLQGLDKENIERGNVLATPGSLVPSLWVDVEVKVLETIARPIKHRAPIRFHSGSVEIMGRVHTLDREELKPGETVFCQVRLEQPVAVMAGDRYVLRSYSPVHTIAGGVILHPHPGRHKRGRPEIMADLATLRQGQAVDKVAVMARLAGERGVTAGELVRLVALSPKDLDALINQMLSKQELVRFDKEGGRLIAGQVQDELMQRALELVAQFHQQQPLKPGMPREELKQRLGRGFEAKLFAHLLNRLATGGELVAEKDLLRLPTHQVRLAADDAKLRERIEKAYVQAGASPPNLKDVIQGEDPKQAKQIVGVLVNEGVLTRIKEDLYYHTPALAEIQGRLVEHLKAHERVGTPQFKEMIGLSRKYVIPLLEHFDTKGLTMRLGDERVLRKN
ncbi:translation elongation factor [Desulfocarbo indianensis]|nr:translation elongation factor [Desulfocarbo indianensis]